MEEAPAQKWSEGITTYKNRCRRIVASSASVRYAGVINEFGRTLTGAPRPGIKPLLRSDQAKNEFFVASTLMSMRKEAVGVLGALDYAILRHENVSIILIQHGSDTYYISVEASEERPETLITSIRTLIFGPN